METHPSAEEMSWGSYRAIEQAVAAAEDYIGRLAREAHASAIADKRKTIMDSDIQKAREKLT
jgi:histone H3/H4